MNFTRFSSKFVLVVAAAAIWMAVAALPAYAADPCCQIVGVNNRTGIVTAKVNATGEQFAFRLSNPAATPSLRVGQPLFANLRNRQVSLDGQHPAGQVVSIASSKAAPLDGIKTSAAPLDGMKNQAAPLDGIKTSAAPLDGIKNQAAPLDGIITHINQAQGTVTSTLNNGQTLELHLNNPSLLKGLALGQSGGSHIQERAQFRPCGAAGAFQYDYYDSGYGGSQCPSGYCACKMPITGQTSSGQKVCGATVVCIKGSPEQAASECTGAGGSVITQQQP